MSKQSFVNASGIFKTEPGNRMEEMPSYQPQQMPFQQQNFFRSPNENSMLNGNVPNNKMFAQNFQNQKLFQHENTEKPTNFPSNKSAQNFPKQNFYAASNANTQPKSFASLATKANPSFVLENKQGYGLAQNIPIEKPRSELFKSKPELPPLFTYHRQHLDEMSNLLRQVNVFIQEMLINSEVQLNPNISESEYQQKLQEILYAKVDAMERFNKVLEDRKKTLLSRQSQKELENHSLFDINRSMVDENRDVFLLDNV